MPLLTYELYLAPNIRYDCFGRLQNANVVKEAEVYYRTIYESYEAAWIIRDRHMFNALVGELARLSESYCVKKHVLVPETGTD